MLGECHEPSFGQTIQHYFEILKTSHNVSLWACSLGLLGHLEAYLPRNYSQYGVDSFLPSQRAIHMMNMGTPTQIHQKGQLQRFKEFVPKLNDWVGSQCELPLSAHRLEVQVQTTCTSVPPV